MRDKIETALEVLDELANSNHEEYYHLMVFNLTADAQHAAIYISNIDFAKLKEFVKDVDQLKKEK